MGKKIGELSHKIRKTRQSNNKKTTSKSPTLKKKSEKSPIAPYKKLRFFNYVSPPGRSRSRSPPRTSASAQQSQKRMAKNRVGRITKQSRSPKKSR